MCSYVTRSLCVRGGLRPAKSVSAGQRRSSGAAAGGAQRPHRSWCVICLSSSHKSRVANIVYHPRPSAAPRPSRGARPTHLKQEFRRLRVVRQLLCAEARSARCSAWLKRRNGRWEFDPSIVGAAGDQSPPHPWNPGPIPVVWPAARRDASRRARWMCGNEVSRAPHWGIRAHRQVARAEDRAQAGRAARIRQLVVHVGSTASVKRRSEQVYVS